MLDLSDGGSTARTCLTFLVIVAPMYLLFRYFVKVVREAYGFAELPPDEGPPLRICPACHNTVLEQDFSHCPYCGAALPAVDGSGGHPGESDPAAP